MKPGSATFFTLPIQGHVGAALPVVRELVERGIAVEAHTSAAFRERLEAVGATVVEYPTDGFEAVERPSSNFLVVAALLAKLTKRTLLGHAAAALDDRRPDVVVVDSMAPWGLLAARRLGVPVVTSTSSFVVHGGLGASPRAALDVVRRLPAGLAALGSIARSRAALRRSGEPDPGGPIRLLSNRGDATVVYTSRALQPGASRLADDVRYVGATLTGGGTTARGGAPASGTVAADRERRVAVDPLLDAIGHGPLIYVSLGTLYNDRPAFYRACIEALARRGEPVVIAAGRFTDVAAIGPQPANVHVVPFAPQLELLARASLFITHGGLNSVHEALWNGVPMVVFPQAADQPVVAERVAKLGAGVVLHGRSPGASAIRRAADRVLADGLAARRSAELGDTLREGGGAATAADIVIAAARAGSSGGAGAPRIVEPSAAFRAA